MQRDRAPWRRDALEHGIDESGEWNIVIDVMADADLAIEGMNGLAQIDLSCRDAKIRVGNYHAEQDKRVCFLHQLGDIGVSGTAHIRPKDGRIRAGEQATTHEAGHDGNAKPARELRDPVFDAVATDLDADHQDGRPGASQVSQDFFRARYGSVSIEAGAGQSADSHNRCVREIARYLDISRQGPIDACPQDARDRFTRHPRIIDHCLVARDLLKDSKLRFRRANLVMHE
jgi:hypothetical protein